MDNLTEKKHRLITPSARQIKALQLVSKGYSKRKAMLEAGYALSTANKESHLLTKSKAAKQITDYLKSGLADAGYDTNFVIQKFGEWFNAQKKDKADYKTQQAAYRFWKDIMEPKQKDDGPLKRKITFEEFIDK